MQLFFHPIHWSHRVPFINLDKREKKLNKPGSSLSRYATLAVFFGGWVSCTGDERGWALTAVLTLFYMLCRKSDFPSRTQHYAVSISLPQKQNLPRHVLLLVQGSLQIEFVYIDRVRLKHPLKTSYISIPCNWNMNEMYLVYKGMLDPIIIS